MPFPDQTPRAFTKENILAIDPGQMGCYGLYRQGVWVYVGRGDIRQRLLDHFNGDNPCITRERPTHWVDVACTDHVTREAQLILELNPVCNKRL